MASTWVFQRRFDSEGGGCAALRADKKVGQWGVVLRRPRGYRCDCGRGGRLVGQIRCRDAACTAAVELCGRLAASGGGSGGGGGSGSGGGEGGGGGTAPRGPACAAVAQADGASAWATLKRGPTPDEAGFLQLRAAADTAAAALHFARLLAARPEWTPTPPPRWVLVVAFYQF